MNFLVVDDNRLLNRFLTTYLRGKGHVASSLTDSSKVEAWLELNPCDGLILDIGMPKIDGLSLISMIRVKHANRGAAPFLPPRISDLRPRPSPLATPPRPAPLVAAAGSPA